MVRRAVPLVVNILVTAPAGIRLHEELAGYFFSPIDLRGAGKKWPRGAVTFAIHAERRQRGILNAPVLVPASFADVTSDSRKRREDDEYAAQPDQRVTGEPRA